MPKNIILTTMSTLPRNLTTNYYYTKDAQQHTLYCDGIAQTEAGTKLFLSQLRIDHIVVIGSDKTYRTDENSKNSVNDFFTTQNLAGDADKYSENPSEYSYPYYRYRIAQFLKKKNTGQTVPADSIPEERRRYLEKITSNYMNSKGYTDPKEWFHILTSDPGHTLSGGLRNEIDVDIRKNFISEDQYEQYLQPVSRYPELIQLENKINDIKDQIEDKTFSLDQLRLDLQDHSFSSRPDDLDYEARLFILSRRLEDNITNLEIEQYITKSAAYREVILVLKDAVNRLIMQVQALKTNRLVREYTYIKSWLYKQLDDSFILKPAKENPTTSLTFVPDMLSSGNYNISGIINAIRSISENDKDDKLDLYIDMQGGNRTDGYVKNAVLSVFNNDKNSRIFIRKVVATEFEPRNFASAIVDETDRYKVTDLVAGMNAFIQYGRADLINTHLQKLGIKKDSHTGKLAAAMVDIDHALSICNVTALTEAIASIRKVFNEPTSEESSEAAEIFRVLEDGIRQDYGNLIANPEIDYYDLTQWAFNKGFIQQAVTIIESKMPCEFVRKGIYYYDDSDNEERKKNIGIFKDLYSAASNNEKVYFNDIDNYFIKRYLFAKAVNKLYNNSKNNNKKRGKGKTGAQPSISDHRVQKLILLLDNSSPNVIKTHTNCGFKKMTPVLEKYFAISDFRNIVNHSKESDESFTYQTITTAISEFLNACRNALSDMRQEDFHVRPITIEDIKKSK